MKHHAQEASKRALAVVTFMGGISIAFVCGILFQAGFVFEVVVVGVVALSALLVVR